MRGLQLGSGIYCGNFTVLIFSSIEETFPNSFNNNRNQSDEAPEASFLQYLLAYGFLIVDQVC